MGTDIHPQFVRGDFIEKGREYWQVTGGTYGKEKVFKVTTARVVRVERISAERIVFELSGEKANGERFNIRHDTRRHGSLQLCNLTDKAVLVFKEEEKKKAEDRTAYEQSDDFKAERLQSAFISFFEHKTGLTLDQCRSVAAALAPLGFMQTVPAELTDVVITITSEPQS